MRLIALRFPVALLACATLVVLAAGSASAQQRTFVDARGDAPASADITHAHLRNGLHRVRVAVRVVDLARGSDITLVVDHPGPGRYILRTGPLGKGSLDFARGSREHRVVCPRWTLARHTGARSLMVVTIPQHCFGARAGTAAIDLTMFQSGGTASDRIPALPVVLHRDG